MKTEIVILLLFVHWVGDFVLQTDEMAKGKSVSNKWLTIHAATYISVFALLSIFILPIWIALAWVIANGALHWGQDYCTSRLNSKLWTQNKRHEYFIAIGADQFIHLSFLLSTLHIAKNVSQ